MTLSAERAYAFVVLLETSPHISLFVRHLYIKGDASRLYRKSHYLDVVIPIIAPKLTSLKTLRVESVTLAHHPNVLSALIKNLSTLHSLYLYSVTFNRFRDFAALVVAHPFLERLDLGQIWWNESVNANSHWEDVFQAHPEPRSRLRSISFNDTSDNVLDWILSHYRVLPVHTVTHSTISTCRIPQMAKLFQVLGSSLEHLTFSIYSPQYSLKPQGLYYFCPSLLGALTPSLESSSADFISSNTSLRTLTFDRLLLTQPTPELYAWMPILLSKVTSPYVEEISFILVWNQLKMLEALNLELMQEIITKSIFSGLKRVVFRLVGDLDPEAARQEIWRRMDQLAERGLLIFRREPITV